MKSRQFHIEVDATKARPTLRLVVNRAVQPEPHCATQKSPSTSEQSVMVLAGARPRTTVQAPVLRVVHHAKGQLRLSGRMVDVCAELDRLEAFEAQMSIERKCA